MKPLDPVRPTEIGAALMENELLRHEVRHLRARLAAAEAAATKPSSKKPTPGKPKPTKPTPGKPVAKKASAKKAAAQTPAPPKAGSRVERRNAEAYDDLVWLLARLDGSPAGPVLRRWAGFRTLRSRYGPDRAS